MIWEFLCPWWIYSADIFNKNLENLNSHSEKICIILRYPEALILLKHLNDVDWQKCLSMKVQSFLWNCHLIVTKEKITTVDKKITWFKRLCEDMNTASMSVRSLTRPMEDQVKFLTNKYFGDIWYLVLHVRSLEVVTSILTTRKKSWATQTSRTLLRSVREFRSHTR